MNAAEAETPMLLDEIIGAGVLRFGLTGHYGPFFFADTSGKVGCHRRGHGDEPSAIAA
jgi:hypothetical protein